MKRQGNDLIIHGLFVDDMMHIPTCDALKQKFREKYTRISISQGAVSWIHIWVCRSSNRLARYVCIYIRETLDEYKAFQTKSLRPKLVLIQPRLVLDKDDCPILPDPRKQKFYRSFVAKLQFAATWIRFDISFAVAQ